jgi:hypothetical protein
MMIIWWSKHVGMILNVLVCDIWINVLLQTSALVGPLYIVDWNARWKSEIQKVTVYKECYKFVRLLILELPVFLMQTISRTDRPGSSEYHIVYKTPFPNISAFSIINFQRFLRIFIFLSTLSADNNKHKRDRDKLDTPTQKHSTML